MHRSHFRLVLGVLVAVTALMVAGAAGGASKKSTWGSMTLGAEQEPPCLNGFTSGCNNTWTSWTAGIALASPLIVKPDFSIKPYMGTAKLVSKKPFTVLVTLNKKAKWSDGKQVSAEDLIFTWKTIVDPKFDISSRSGFDSIARAVKVNARAVKFIYSKPYAPYKVQWATSILPQHALEGLDFNTVWDSNYNNKAGQTMSSGPFKLQSYTKGQSLVMVRNSTFWGKKPTLDKITFLFRTNTDTEIQAIRGGEVDAIYPQPQLQLAQLRGQSGLRVQTHAGTTIEHIDINTGAGNSTPLLGQAWFRQAIAYSLDRSGMIKQLFSTLNPGLPTLNNLSYTTGQKGLYVPHFAKYQISNKAKRIAKVAAIMKAHNCTKGGDGIYTCGGEKASVRLGTTSGNKLRELAVEIMQAQAKDAGIEFRADSQPSRLFFQRISANKYDLALFAWVGTGDPAGQVDIYGCADAKTPDNPQGIGGLKGEGARNPTVAKAPKAAERARGPEPPLKRRHPGPAKLPAALARAPLRQQHRTSP